MGLLDVPDISKLTQDFDEYAEACALLSASFNTVCKMEHELRHRYGVNWEIVYNKYAKDRGRKPATSIVSD